ncbi:MAG: hypothetical protein EAZ09_11960 [Oscillatoriales cyanobacterium]|nr:MAG: hypothetical protein EAZ18_20380 [Oscillatoriales cyanobacterium]TAH21799.1 MAG: hypothetical protein EAZ09_11960 [Oscillatoriales cyanobacterium]
MPLSWGSPWAGWVDRGKGCSCDQEIDAIGSSIISPLAIVRFQLSRSECRSKRQANYLETIHIEYSKIDTIINNLPRIIAITLQSGEP